MKRRFSYLLLGAVAFVSLGLFTSCKDYDNSEEVRLELMAADAELRQQIADMQDALGKINSCTCNFIENGQLTEQGKAAIYSYLNELGYVTWTIGPDGYWYKNGVKTEFFSRGADGQNGIADKWTIGDDGYWYLNGDKTNYKAIGKDGVNGTNGTNGTNGKDADVWTIGDDGYWYKNGVKTDNKAIGKDGKDGQDGVNTGDSWTIGDDGYWYKNGEKTDKKAVGTDGKDGQNGQDGAAWTIGEDGFWYLNGEKTTYKAIGQDGKDGKDGKNGTNGKDGKDGKNGTNADVWTIGTDGFWYKNGVKTEYKAIGEDGQDGTGSADKWTIGTDGYWYLNGTKTEYKAIGQDGSNGADGATWTIGTDGYWYKNGEKTEYKAIGQDGTADQWTIGTDGYWYLNGTKTEYKAIGTDGSNGVDGATWTIGTDGYWYKNGTKTEYLAQGPAGPAGADGQDGKTPGIDDEYYWTMDGVRILVNGQPVKAIGQDGTNGTNGTDWSDDQIREKVLQIIKEAFGVEDDPLTQDELEKIINEVINLHPTIVHLQQIHNDIVNTYTTLGYTSLPDYMEKVDAQVKQNKADIATIKEDIEKLKERVEKLEKAEKKFISSIVINEAWNPIYGRFNLPFDLRSNLLFGYYGKSAIKGEFPSAVSDGFYANTVYSLSDEDYNMINPSDIYEYKSGDILVEDGEDGKFLNLGKLYLTVNPTKIDYSGTEFTLENSAKKASDAILSPLKPSTHKITFGYTRAAIESEAQNGFYETEVKFAKADVLKNTLDINMDGLKAEAKELIKSLKSTTVDVNIHTGKVSITRGEAFNVSQLVQVLYNSVRDVTDAYAVKATWNDDVAGERSVYSQYGIGAAAIPAFGGYSSFKDFNYVTVPGYEQAWAIIDKVAGAVKTNIKKAWPDFSDLKMPTIEYVTFTPSTDPSKWAINVTIKYKAESGYIYTPGEDGYLWVYDSHNTLVGRIPFGKVTKEGDDVILTVYNYQKDLSAEFNNLLAAVQEAYGDVNETYDDLKDLMADVNALLVDVNKIEGKIENGTDKAAKMLQNWLASANSRIVNFVNSANYRLQPILVANTDKGSFLCSSAKNYATGISSSTYFVLTNYFGEIIAPALKKHLACTNVFKGTASAQGGDAACKSALEAVNKGDLNKVLPGSTIFVSASGFQAGYVYELALSCLDYEGYQSTRKVYVTVK